MVTSNYIAARLDARLGSDLSESDQAMLGAIKGYMATGALQNHNWDFVEGARFVQGVFSQETRVDMYQASCESMRCLATMQALLDKKEGLEVMDSWRDIRKELNDLMSELGRGAASWWQTVDIGHGFEHFGGSDLVLGMVCSKEDFRYELNDLPKTSKAVVLEDDSKQRANCRQMINDMTVYDCPEELAFATPDGIAGLECDPNVGAFILDIQNGEDDLAGVRIAERIITERLAIWQACAARGEECSLPEVKIIVWSASKNHVDYAAQYLKEIVRDHLDCVAIAVPGSAMGDDKLIQLDVGLKSWPSTFRRFTSR
jgi:hypothetical protein